MVDFGSVCLHRDRRSITYMEEGDDDDDEEGEEGGRPGVFD